MAESKTSQNRLEAAKKQSEALIHRRNGATFDQIARLVGYKDASGAFYAVTAALDRTLREPAEALRTLELDRIDAAHRAIWPKVLDGDLPAVDRFLRLQVRRSRLLGLDAPVKVDLRHIVSQMAEQYGLTPSETEELHKDVANFLAIAREQTSGKE